jgi:hypothetical protein
MPIEQELSGMNIEDAFEESDTSWGGEAVAAELKMW